MVAKFALAALVAGQSLSYVHGNNYGAELRTGVQYTPSVVGGNQFLKCSGTEVVGGCGPIATSALNEKHMLQFIDPEYPTDASRVLQPGRPYCIQATTGESTALWSVNTQDVEGVQAACNLEADNSLFWFAYGIDTLDEVSLVNVKLPEANLFIGGEEQTTLRLVQEQPPQFNKQYFGSFNGQSLGLNCEGETEGCALSLGDKSDYRIRFVNPLNPNPSSQGGLIGAFQSFCIESIPSVAEELTNTKYLSYYHDGENTQLLAVSGHCDDESNHDNNLVGNKWFLTYSETGKITLLPESTGPIAVSFSTGSVQLLTADGSQSETIELFDAPEMNVVADVDDFTFENVENAEAGFVVSDKKDRGDKKYRRAKKCDNRVGGRESYCDRESGDKETICLAGDCTLSFSECEYQCAIRRDCRFIQYEYNYRTCTIYNGRVSGDRTKDDVVCYECEGQYIDYDDSYCWNADYYDYSRFGNYLSRSEEMSRDENKKEGKGGKDNKKDKKPTPKPSKKDKKPTPKPSKKDKKPSSKPSKGNKRPTPSPTKKRKPTPKPTRYNPTPRPTKRSKQKPTPRPTKRNEKPTPRPTKRNERPTPRPTKRNERPTPRPTKRNERPTPRPTRRPNKRPRTKEPTKRPTRRPNRRPGKDNGRGKCDRDSENVKVCSNGREPRTGRKCRYTEEQCHKMCFRHRKCTGFEWKDNKKNCRLFFDEVIQDDNDDDYRCVRCENEDRRRWFDEVSYRLGDTKEQVTADVASIMHSDGEIVTTGVASAVGGIVVAMGAMFGVMRYKKKNAQDVFAEAVVDEKSELAIQTNPAFDA